MKIPARSWAVAALAAAGLAAPASALADAPTNRSVEPIVLVPGYTGYCPSTVAASGGRSSEINGLVNSPDPSWTVTGMPGTVVTGVPSTKVYTWATDYTLPANEQYDQCNGGSIRTLSQRFYNRIKSLTKPKGKLGPGKIDVIGYSLGSVVTRACIKNVSGTTPDCADMIDDWIGIVGPSHGTTLFSGSTCAASGLILAPASLCHDLSPGSDFLLALNSGDETPGSGEFSTIWSANDGLIVPAATSAVNGGAANVQMRATTTSAVADDPTHATLADNASCPGATSSAVGAKANVAGSAIEWAALELLDVMPHANGTWQAYCNAGPVPAPPH